MENNIMENNKLKYSYDLCNKFVDEFFNNNPKREDKDNILSELTLIVDEFSLIDKYTLFESERLTRLSLQAILLIFEYNMFIE